MTGGRRAAGTALLALLLVSGCGVTSERAARPLTSADAPVGLLQRPTPSAQPSGARDERLLFVRDARLVPVSRTAERVSPQSALEDLLAGPLPAERERGLTTALPAAAGPGMVVVRGGIAEVSLGGGLLDSGRSDQVLALAQVVTTLAGLPDVTAVRFVRDGQDLPVPRGDGAIVPGPLTAADYGDLLVPR